MTVRWLAGPALALIAQVGFAQAKPPAQGDCAFLASQYAEVLTRTASISNVGEWEILQAAHAQRLLTLAMARSCDVRPFIEIERRFSNPD